MYKKFYKPGHKRKFDIFASVILFMLCIAVIIPFLRILSYSLHNNTMHPFAFFYGDTDHLIVYKYIFGNSYWVKSILVSVFSTAAVTVLGFMISSVSAYILTQRKMPGVRLFGYFIIFALVFDAGLVPKFLLIKNLGIYNTLWAVILPLSLNAFNIILLRKYFEQLPKDILDAAELDGCTPFTTFFKIVLPMSKAPLAVICMLFVAAAWNEYIGFLMYIPNFELRNLQYMVRDREAELLFSTTCGFVDEKACLSAFIMLASLPAFIMAPLMRKFFDPSVFVCGVKE